MSFANYTGYAKRVEVFVEETVEDVAIADLAQPDATIIICLKLYGCKPVTSGVTIRQPDSLEQYLNFGRKAGEFCRYHVDRAAEDHDANQAARELARELLEATFASRLPKEHIETASMGIAALFLWLVLHDCKQGPVLRAAMLQAIQQMGHAVVTIGCSRRRAYVITVGNSVVDLRDALRRADHDADSFHELGGIH